MTERLPEIKFAPALAPSKAIGEKPDLQWIELSALRLDKAYQRDILIAGRKNVRQIAEHFSWSRLSPLVVSDRGDGTFAIIDGQHRAAAALAHGGIATLPCLVIVCSLVEEARAFAAINGKITQLKTLQVFHAELAAGDSGATALKKLCESSGVTIPRLSCALDKPGMTLAVGCLRRAMSLYGSEVLSAVLKLIVETGDGNAGLLQTGVINGLCDVIKKHPQWAKQRQKLADAIEQASVRKVYASAKRIQAVDGGPLQGHFSAIITRAIEKHFDLRMAA